MMTGLIAKFIELVADSLDMIADSFVYGISLFAVVGTLLKKKRTTKLSGYFQIILTIIRFVEDFLKSTLSANNASITLHLLIKNKKSNLKK
jgi:hypothetical protein